MITRGQLDTGAAPTTGERFTIHLNRGGIQVESIVSSLQPALDEYLQSHDEWVAVLEGEAAVEVGGEAITLTAGDWALLPAGIPHRVTRTELGTRWLAVHLAAGLGPPREAT